MEKWLPVVGYEGLYEVSDMGRVRSANYRNTGKPRPMKARRAPNGYLRLGLRKNGETKYFSVHRLVGTAFIPNPEGLPQINHIDGDKSNNVLSNLEWCTGSQNIKHAYETGKKEKCREHARDLWKIGQEFRKEYLEEIKKPVVVKNIKTGEVTRYESVNAAARGTGADPANVSRVLKGTYSQTKGYVFKYEEVQNGEHIVEQG